MTASITLFADPSPRAIARVIKGLGRSLRTWRPAFKAVLPYVAQGIRDNIRSRGASVGSPWARLATSTLRRKARLGQTRGPLIGSGENIDKPLNGGAIVKLSATRMSYGVKGLVANVQHFGRKKGDLPPRRYMAWNASMEAVLHLAMERHAQKLLTIAREQMAGFGQRADSLARGMTPAPVQRAIGPRSRDERGRFTRGGS